LDSWLDVLVLSEIVSESMFLPCSIVQAKDTQSIAQSNYIMRNHFHFFRHMSRIVGSTNFINGRERKKERKKKKRRKEKRRKVRRGGEKRERERERRQIKCEKQGWKVRAPKMRN